VGIVTVRSPQFKDAEWKYKIFKDETTKDRGVSLLQRAGESKNPFVETTVRYVLSYIKSSDTLPGAIFTIFADNDYYSQPPSTKPLPRFNTLNVPISSAHKTGLGSSAALVTSLTACLLSSFSPEPLDFSEPSAQRTLHNLAQASHCAAQGKVGSGFDVATAVYGSCIYHRFSPSVLEAVGDTGSEGFATRLADVIDKAWDLNVERTRMPPGLRLTMGDVDCGSATPGMVKKVLSWRKEDPIAAKKQWDTIEGLNIGLRLLLDQVRERAQSRPEEYQAALKQVQSGSSVNQNECYSLLQRISESIQNIRGNIRAMGEVAGVPIEPPAQTKLLDSTVSAINGVLGGVVPGAGGYDAVVFITIDTQETTQDLKAYLAGWEFESGSKSEGKVKALETREEHEGLRKEQLSKYKF